MESREVKCPSGAVLKIQPSPFAVSKALYQAVLKEVANIQVKQEDELANFIKNLFCAGFSSPEIEGMVWKCMERCLYNTGTGDLRITEQSFEPVERRQDYMFVCMEVVKENIDPFGKVLFAEFKRYMGMIADSRK